jgi:hypothetical protein
METWDLWYPDAAAAGLPFARGRMDRHDVIWVHAAPQRLTVEVRDDAGHRLARGERLAREGSYLPMTLLRREGESIVREDRWPQDDDAGTPVLLPGGETGILKEWWNAADGNEWRWSVEFYNRR